uniref:Uncharacterized protein n=1 Tax=Anguilla anguilla TaxID=7936 RepID=A0A0E9VTP4_ANGAN
MTICKLVPRIGCPYEIQQHDMVY